MNPKIKKLEQMRALYVPVKKGDENEVKEEIIEPSHITESEHLSQIDGDSRVSQFEMRQQEMANLFDFEDPYTQDAQKYFIKLRNFD